MRNPAEAVRALWGRSRAFRIVLITASMLVVIAAVLDRALDRPLRRVVERRINQNLVGYTAHVGGSNFHIAGLALVLTDTVISQDAHPDPPVIEVPHLRMSVHWLDLLYLRIVADASFVGPIVHVDLEQFEQETRDPVPLIGRGWQSALESIYPLKVNELTVTDGQVVYQDSGFRPLHLSAVDIVARNIRNVRSRKRTYPSSFHAKATVFDAGSAVIDGRADFLAEPIPGVQGRLDLRQVELSYFEPIAKRLGLSIHKGFLSGSGSMEWGPEVRSVDLESVEIASAAVDYASGAGPTPLAQVAGKRIAEVAKTSLNNPEIVLRARRVVIRDGTLTMINQVADPHYRLEFSHANVMLTNFSSRAEDGPARATLEGAFMNSGSMKAEATFYPEGKHANVQGKVVIENTPLASMNDILRAKGKFDVSEGQFDLYSEFRVRDGAVEGYVKPLFRDVKVLDAEQDKHKNVFRKMYEGIIGGAAKLLENHHGEVATVTSLDGPLGNPKANAMEALGGLLRNAFVKAILPGFQHEIQRIEPVKYRAALKKERKANEEPRAQ